MSQRESTAAGPAWSDDLGRRLEEQRARLKAAVDAHRQQAHQCETSIQSQLAAIQQAIASAGDHRGDLESVRQSLEATHQAHIARQQALLDDITSQLKQLQQREAAIAKQHAEATAAQAEVDVLRRACDDAQQTMAQREAASRQRDDALREREETVRQRNDALRDAQRTVTDRETSLARREEELKLGQQRLRSQRLTVAHELRARRKEMLAEAERQRVEAAHAAAGDDSVLAVQLAEAKLQVTKLRAAEDTHVHDHMALEEKLEQAKRELAEMHEMVKMAESRPAGEGGSSEAADDLRQRLDMALADVRDLKQRNAELTEQLAKGPAGGAVVPISGGGPMDWEARKQQLLAQLESDFDEGDPKTKANKLTVEEAVRRTEEVVSAKNSEIAELQRLLSEQSGNIGGVAIGAAAIAEMLDTDELVRQERESLRDLQEKLREQLKQAEIDLSVERAKIARERAILDEKMRTYEEQKQNNPAATDDAGNTKKTSGGRWLQRLGLRNDEQKS